MSESAAAPNVEYSGNCHCGAVKFTVNIPEIKETSGCECSFCSKKGVMWSIVPVAAFSFIRGENHLKAYEFNKKTLSHKFCPTCGTQCVSTAPPGSPLENMIGLNLRTLMNLDPWVPREVKMHDGKNYLPAYVPPPFEGPPPTLHSPSHKLYTGSCHCGLVRLALSSPPLPTCTVKEDNCSICIRNGSVFVYPSPKSVSITGDEHLTTYTFAKKFASHNFCSTCGTYMFIRILGPSKEVQDSWTEEVREKNAKNWDMMPVTLRILEGVEWDEIKVERSIEQASAGEPYVVD